MARHRVALAALAQARGLTAADPRSSDTGYSSPQVMGQEATQLAMHLRRHVAEDRLQPLDFRNRSFEQ